ncbi:FadR/GntR family transcriptional regulator [Fluviibacterium sp. DFM31]|uniref:FadR/GntR family transcriptional regulator n=1 Tax=Meridianimarinicoccus marinus TaxID=3231483 RepID=A0ABV3L760_9RHOB
MSKKPSPVDLATAGRQPLRIKRKSVSEQVIDRFLDLIRDGYLKPGDQLPPERDLSAQFDVSRPTVREALRALSILGVLEIRQGGGAFVTALDADELLSPLDWFISLNKQNLAEVFEARIEFEPLLARLAAPRISSEARTRMHQMVAAQQAAPDDAELFHDTDVEFHKILIEAAGNMYLERVGKLLQVIGDQGRRAFLHDKSVRLQSVADHVAILSALDAGDADAAAKAMRNHMQNVRAALQAATGT